MPQKPSVYRSFMTCGDPEGVVNCGTVRKENRNYIPKSFDMSCSSTGLRDEGVRNLRSSSSQLEEIEKGAQNLNKMIDSWASGMTSDRKPKDNIAKDLLRGALDLQESLNMLSKFQQASMYMAKLKRLERHDETGPISDLEHRWGRRGSSFVSEGRSSSSGQSSVSFSKKACSVDNSSVSSDNSGTNRIRTNVIAKLMGLDDRKLVQATARTSSEVHDDIQVLPAFDFEMPMSKKPHVSTQTRYQDKKTLRELLEATQSKDVLDLVPKTTPKSRDDVSHNFPPIVLMKPLHSPCKELENGQERRFDASDIINELKAKNWFSQVQDRVSEKVSLMKIEKSTTCTPQVLIPATSKPCKSAVAKLQTTKAKIKEKTVVSAAHTSQANKFHKIVKSPDVSNSVRRVSKEKSMSGTKLPVSKERLVPPSKSSNQDKNLSIMKTQTSVPRKLLQATASTITKKSSIDYSVNVKKTQKKKGKPLTRPISTYASRHEDDATSVDLSCEVTHAVPLLVKTETTTRETNEENWRDVEVMHDNSVQERSDKYFKDVECERITTNTSCLKSRSFRQSLLMSSPTFAASVEVLFHLKVSSTSSKDIKPSIHMEDDTALFISYAKEVLERRSNHLLASATPVSLNQLLEEVCDAYEAIDSYKDGIPAGDIFVMLDRDMKYKEIVSSIWDLGWRNGHSAAETEQIVTTLEILILRDIVDEIFVH